ncbi:MAG: MarR family transcriptional regulator [Lachnospiraceae bacterium]|nr:MarR family transcriptional regulator [Lachnospiraceae bacterium]
MKDHKEEIFFLDNFNIDRVFGTIGRADYLFLYYIKKCADESGQQERAYLSELAEAMHLAIPEISKAMENLQEKGYISWKTDNSAGKTYVKLTSKAVELMSDERLRMKECYEKIREEIGEEELSRMVQTMKKITGILKRINGNAGVEK